VARKRAKLKKWDYNSREYWNRLLAMEGLSLSAGLNRHIVYVGDSGKLDYAQERQSEEGYDAGTPPQAT
jgi:hypothetical protein